MADEGEDIVLYDDDGNYNGHYDSQGEFHHDETLLRRHPQPRHGTDVVESHHDSFNDGGGGFGSGYGGGGSARMGLDAVDRGGQYDQYDQFETNFAGTAAVAPASYPAAGGDESLGGHPSAYDQGIQQPTSAHFEEQHYDDEPQYVDEFNKDEKDYFEDGEGDFSQGGSVPDALYLSHYCANAFQPADSSEEARLEADKSWQPVRDWLRNHTAGQVRAAAEQRNDSLMTALHFACRNAPPPDVMDVLLSIAIDTVRWSDNFGWLPIHYACAYGADTRVIKSLAEAYPESKTTVDRRGRTPLHFALGNANPDKVVSPEVVALLSSTGAAGYADDNGMYPLHYACAYGASEDALYVLTNAHPEAITAMDRQHRTPLNFVLSNAGRKAAPAAVRLLLGLNKDIINSNRRGGSTPLRVLAEFALKVRRDAGQRESVRRCLEYMLLAQPDPTADFFTALQSLPEWLQEQAVVMPEVQRLLNDKITQRFPTGVLISDFYVQILVITFYSFLVPEAIDRRFDFARDDSIGFAILIPLYFGGSYYLVREIIQILSLISLRSFHIWLYDPSNYLNVVYIFIVYFWTFQMQMGNMDRQYFRTGAALSIIVLWLKFLAYLRNVLIDFAVFVGGVFYVVRRLAAFLLALAIILIAFSQMFFTIFRGNDEYCSVDPTDTCDDGVRPYCDRWEAFLNIYTMLLGEVNESQFAGSLSATILFIVFMFLVVILLANVLIAIVTDSYKVIQDQRAAIVFWTNRLDFVAEMDAIANGPWKDRLMRGMGMSVGEGHFMANKQKVTFGETQWQQLLELYDDDLDESALSLEYLCYTLLRIAAALFIIPLWILLGLVSVGWFWPPQIREAIFTSSVFKHSSDVEKEDELRRNQVRGLEVEVKTLKDDLLQELAIDRTQVVQMKSLVAERKQEIQGEMKHIKRIVTLLFEQQATA